MKHMHDFRYLKREEVSLNHMKSSLLLVLQARILAWSVGTLVHGWTSLPVILWWKRRMVWIAIDIESSSSVIISPAEWIYSALKYSESCVSMMLSLAKVLWVWCDCLAKISFFQGFSGRSWMVRMMKAFSSRNCSSSFRSERNPGRKFRRRVRFWMSIWLTWSDFFGLATKTSFLVSGCLRDRGQGGLTLKTWNPSYWIIFASSRNRPMHNFKWSPRVTYSIITL